MTGGLEVTPAARSGHLHGLRTPELGQRGIQDRPQPQTGGAELVGDEQEAMHPHGQLTRPGWIVGFAHSKSAGEGDDQGVPVELGKPAGDGHLAAVYRLFCVIGIKSVGMRALEQFAAHVSEQHP